MTRLRAEKRTMQPEQSTASPKLRWVGASASCRPIVVHQDLQLAKCKCEHSTQLWITLCSMRGSVAIKNALWLTEDTHPAGRMLVRGAVLMTRGAATAAAADAPPPPPLFALGGGSLYTKVFSSLHKHQVVPYTRTSCQACASINTIVLIGRVVTMLLALMAAATGAVSKLLR